MEHELDSATDIIADAVTRLAALDSDRTYRFRATRRVDAEAHLAKTGAILGCSEQEISDRETLLGGRYPDLFREYLLILGRRGGQLFRGSDVGFDQHGELRRIAAGLLAEGRVADKLPDDADVFLVHQGYSFMYVRAVGGPDCPVYGYVEGERAATVMWDSFRAMLESELTLMEANHRASRDAGGTWLQVDDRGAVTETYPARESGRRPLDHPDAYLD